MHCIILSFLISLTFCLIALKIIISIVYSMHKYNFKKLLIFLKLIINNGPMFFKMITTHKWKLSSLTKFKQISSQEKCSKIPPWLTPILLKDHFHGYCVDNIFDYMRACIDTEIRYHYSCQYIFFIFGILPHHTEYWKLTYVIFVWCTREIIYVAYGQIFT